MEEFAKAKEDNDIRACAKYKTSMNQEQRTLLYSILRRITEVLESKGYNSEAGEIHDIKGALFHH
jgi:hypothetical protein